MDIDHDLIQTKFHKKIVDDDSDHLGLNKFFHICFNDASCPLINKSLVITNLYLFSSKLRDVWMLQ